MEGRFSLFKFIVLASIASLMIACGGNSDTSPAEPQSDTTPPVITLNGESNVSISYGREYLEEGATAIDSVDGEVAVNISGAINVLAPETYIIVYTAVDSSGNQSQLTRQVTVEQQRAFITTWDTHRYDKYGVTGDNQIKIETKGEGYNFTIDWGDGSIEENVTASITHTYQTPGLYTLKITGEFPRFYMYPSLDVDFYGYEEYPSDNSKLKSIEQWGDIIWLSMGNAFSDAINLEVNAEDIPNLSNVTDMSYMFMGAKAINSNLNNWDTSSVTNMTGLFHKAKSFNQNISNWDVSNVTNMNLMFSGAEDFNQDIGSWDVSNVTNMHAMFGTTSRAHYWCDTIEVDGPCYEVTFTYHGAKNFNQDISSWNVANVTSMSSMFRDSTEFNQDISNWNVSNVTDLGFMFSGAESFNQDIGSWDVSNVTNMQSMFFAATAFNRNISSWNTSRVTNMESMFKAASVFNQNIGTWNVANVTDMNSMFENANVFNQSIGNWDVTKVTSMTSMFKGAEAFNHNLGDWDVSNVTTMKSMFEDAVAFNQVVESWNVSSVTSMLSMFKNARAFNQYIGSWDVSSVATMVSMFENANAFNQNIGSWDVSNVTDMVAMFSEASSFDQNLGSWNITSVISWQNDIYVGGLLVDSEEHEGMTAMFSGVQLSTENYDALLIGWSEQEVHKPINWNHLPLRFNAGNSLYSEASAAARAKLINDFSWNIEDGGSAN